MTLLEMLAQQNIKVLSESTDGDIVTVECENVFGTSMEPNTFAALAAQGYTIISVEAHLERKYTIKLRKPS